MDSNSQGDFTTFAIEASVTRLRLVGAPRPAWTIGDDTAFRALECAGQERWRVGVPVSRPKWLS